MDSLTAYLPTSIKGKRILITGGTTGIGRATAILLASQGARLMIYDRHQHPLDEITASRGKRNIVEISSQDITSSNARAATNP